MLCFEVGDTEQPQAQALFSALIKSLWRRENAFNERQPMKPLTSLDAEDVFIAWAENPS